jgi:hypothetical protein
MPLLSHAEIKALLSQQTIVDQFPWNTNEEVTIDAFYKGIVAKGMRLTETQSRVEWNHYGSGYASFIDAWFYQATNSFNVATPIGYGEEHTGLVVLLSRLSPYFVFMEGEKTWHSKGGSSYLPELNMVDRFHSPAVSQLAEQFDKLLTNEGRANVKFGVHGV